MTMYSEAKIKARKSHKCSSCGDNIAKGETYTDIIDTTCLGYFQKFSLCSCCDIVLSKIKDEGLEGYYSIENTSNYLFDTQDIDETAADIADKLKLPAAYVAGIINR